MLSISSYIIVHGQVMGEPNLQVSLTEGIPLTCQCFPGWIGCLKMMIDPFLLVNLKDLVGFKRWLQRSI